MKVKIEINCDNDSLASGDETVADVLHKLAENLEYQELNSIENTIIRDINGNKILWLTVERD